jgi:hypothetical protein
MHLHDGCIGQDDTVHIIACNICTVALGVGALRFSKARNTLGWKSRTSRKIVNDRSMHTTSKTRLELGHGSIAWEFLVYKHIRSDTSTREVTESTTFRSTKAPPWMLKCRAGRVIDANSNHLLHTTCRNLAEAFIISEAF